ncbi:TolC family protein [Fuerstiella marisgermanici]|uniref:TolC family protein n=1 Tax=Fuerstiella marisgermanici TaxID=1891926 RepID=UPI00131468F1|nr:TolC family protein [Fuerstiella marisgermanici]
MQADCDAEQLVAERTEPIFFLPDRSVQAAAHSRMADFSDPDCGPLPPDDPAAARFMDCPYKAKGSRVWHERGQLADIEFEHWRSFLPQDDEGVVPLNRQTAMELALLHSRDYQTQVEGVYLQALPVSLQRFQFDAQWTGGAGLAFLQRGGHTAGSTRTLSLTDGLGVSKRFATGGQLLADFSNAMTWEYNGGVSSAASVLSFQFLQPLMRRAFREVQLEPLTQAERNLLYSVRDFARFRRTFFVSTVGTNGYLGLLAVAQAIRNEEANLESLRRNLEEHIALYETNQASQFQVDQVYQEYAQGRLSLMRAQATYNTELDRYKLQLGLPSTLHVKLNSEELKQFELNDPRLEKLTDRNDATRIGLLQFSEDELPSMSELRPFYAECEAMLDLIPELTSEVKSELETWTARLKADTERTSGDPDDEASVERQRELELAERLTKVISEILAEFPADVEQLETARTAIDADKPLLAWEALNLLCGDQLRERLDSLFVVQTQVRVYLIQTKPVEISEDTAIWLAENNRLDLKNQQGRVVDAYRRTEVAADLLEADLDLVLGADLGTDPGRINPLRFDSSASTLRAGLQFDGPLNRMAERNDYRASQIEYQRARRNYMAARDSILFDVRKILRNLNLNRFSFEISRQQLITAARQVEQAQIDLRNAEQSDSNLTRNLLQALQSLLQARNSLIASWVSYETSRMQLHQALGILQVDDSGSWINDGQTFDNFLDINDAPLGFERELDPGLDGDASGDEEVPVL